MHALLKGNPTVMAIVASVLALAILGTTFSLFEPIVSHGQSPNRPFTIDQEITSEISFRSDPNNVIMDGTIAGLAGGITYGTSTFNVSTNNPDGYTVEITFSSTTAMQSTSTDSVIPNYDPAAGGSLADYTFTVDPGEAWFAYTVENETSPTDIDATFKDDGASTCDGTDIETNDNTCWFNKDAANSPEQIIDAPGATPATGATSSVTFVVGVGSNPTPALETGWYRATATLTAILGTP